LGRYENFSELYDVYMKDVPYDKWIEYIKKIWKKYNHNPKLIAELGCGTGNITQRLAKDKYNMIGIDISEQMLSKAKEKALKENTDILYLNQDMREFELYGTVDCILCLCDSINYITEEKDLLKVFKLVNNYLEPKGLFIFDMNTIYKFKNILGENSFSETNDFSAYTWENYFDENENINEYYTNFFILNKKSGEYKRYEEYHYEKGYTIETIKNIIELSGLKFVDVYDELTFNKPNEKSQRIYFVAQEIIK